MQKIFCMKTSKCINLFELLDETKMDYQYQRSAFYLIYQCPKLSDRGINETKTKELKPEEIRFTIVRHNSLY